MASKILYFNLYFVFLFSNQVFCAQKTWDGGGGDLKWTTAKNWNGDVLPKYGDSIELKYINTSAINYNIYEGSYNSLQVNQNVKFNINIIFNITYKI